MKSKMIRKTLLGLALAASTSTGYGAVIAAWDMNNNGTLETGWTDFVSNATTGATSTVGGITLTQAGGTFAVNSSGFGTTIETDPALRLNPSANLGRGINVAPDTYVAPTFTLSGLTVGETYEIQFTGHVRYNNLANASERNMQMQVDGGTFYTLFDLPVPYDTVAGGVQNFAGYSNIATFTATALDTDVVLTFSKTDTSTVSKYFSGIIVSQVPEPSTALLSVIGSLALLRRRRK